MDDYAADLCFMNTKQIVMSAPQKTHGHRVSSTEPLKTLLKRKGSETKQTSSVAVFFLRLTQSHANMFVNNKVWLVYEHSIVEACTAVFARYGPTSTRGVGGRLAYLFCWTIPVKFYLDARV